MTTIPEEILDVARRAMIATLVHSADASDTRPAQIVAIEAAISAALGAGLTEVIHADHLAEIERTVRDSLAEEIYFDRRRGGWVTEDDEDRWYPTLAALLADQPEVYDDEDLDEGASELIAEVEIGDDET